MSPSEEIANWEIFLWALHQLGGSSFVVDIEDVSVRCFEIAPARFSWRTKATIPDYKKCAKALQEAEVRRPRMLVKTGDSFGRQLTAEGQKWIQANTKRLQRVLDTAVPVPEPKGRPSSKILAEIENSGPYQLWKGTGTVPHDKWRVAEVLRCSPDSSPETWTDRLQSARAIAYSADRVPVLRFLDQVAHEHPEWFEGQTT